MESQHADQQQYYGHSIYDVANSPSSAIRRNLILRGSLERDSGYSLMQRVPLDRYFNHFLDQSCESLLLGLRFVVVHALLSKCSFKRVRCILPFEQSVHIFVQRSDGEES